MNNLIFGHQATERNLKSPSLIHCRIASLLKSLILVLIIRSYFVQKWKIKADLESPLQKTASTDLISHENRIAGKSADTAYGNIKDEHLY